MKTIVISYSFTGNNEAIAKSIAAELAAEHIKITELKSRNMGTIVFDMLFNRIPKVNPHAGNVTDKDLVLFVGPIWMEQVATPFRTCFKHLQGKLDKYAFISVHGGPNGPKHRIADELNKSLGKEPAAVIELYIADLLPPDLKTNRKAGMDYRLNDKEVKSLTATVVKTIKETMAK